MLIGAIPHQAFQEVRKLVLLVARKGGDPATKGTLAIERPVFKRHAAAIRHAHMDHSAVSWEGRAFDEPTLLQAINHPVAVEREMPSASAKQLIGTVPRSRRRRRARISTSRTPYFWSNAICTGSAKITALR